MKTERILAALAFVISVVALAVSLRTMYGDPFGGAKTTYDLSSPENTLRSLNRLVTRRDLRGGIELLADVLQGENTPESKIYFDPNVEIHVVKSLEIAKSGFPTNVGTVVSFVTLMSAGVEYHTVVCFKHQGSRFVLGDQFIAPYGDTRLDEDKALEAMIDGFKKTGRL